MSPLEQCLQRIRDILAIDDDFGQQCQNATDLCKLLADGEKLCCILCVLSDGQISADGEGTVSFYSENSQLLAKRNVKFFLQKSCEHFGLKRDDLFEPEDLMELRRPEKVVQALQTLLERPYQVLVIRRKSEMPMISEEMTGPGVSQNIVHEICRSEKQLVDKLRKQLWFRRELRGPLSLWSPELLEHTFLHTEDLLAVHENLENRLSGLAARGLAEFCRGLGKLFATAKVELAIYAKYFSHYPLAKARLEEEFNTSPQLKHQVNLLERHFAIDSFNQIYEAPLRRVFNYSMLFDRLFTTVTRELPDTARSVEEALMDCKSLLNHLNECKRNSEKATVTRQLLQKVDQLPADLSSPSIVGLHRGDGVFRVKRGQEPECESFCLLTDRFVIVAKPKGREGKSVTRMRYLYSVEITEQLALDYGPQDTGPTNAGRISGASLPNSLTRTLGRQIQLAASRGGKAGLDLTPAFKLLLPDGTAVSFSARRSAELGLWGQLVTKAKAFNYPKGWNSGGHRFQLQTFPVDSAKCSQCNEPFIGCAYQGYRCDHCQVQLDQRCFQAHVAPKRPLSYVPGEAAVARREPQQNEFFHGHLDRRSAELVLSHHGPGDFLVRESGDRLVLSIAWEDERCFHMILRQREGYSQGVEVQYSIDYKVNDETAACTWHNSLESLASYYQTARLKIGECEGVGLARGIPAAR